jgi:hypothetical protein
VSRKSLDKEKFEYRRHSLAKWANILTNGKGMPIAHIHKRSIVKNCSELLTTDSSEGL